MEPEEIKALEKSVQDATKTVQDLKTAQEAAVREAKTIAEGAKSEATEAKAETVKLDATVKVIKDAADKNQEWIDKQIANQQARITEAGEKKSFDQVLAEKIEEKTDDILKLANKDSGRQSVFIDITGAEMKTVGDVAIANYTGGTRGLTLLRPGLIESPKRKVHIRQLLPTGTIGPGTEFVFMREDGAGEGAIAAVAEGVEKPQIDIDLVEASVKVETIAGWLRVTRKAMKNIPGFISFLQSRLPEKLLRVEDNYLLNGTGSTPQIKGIMVAGNFTAATGSATVDIEQLVYAISQLEDEEEREANGILLRPADYYRIVLNKAAGSGEYDLPGIVSVQDGTLRIAGVPTYHSTAMTADKFLVGDFRLGAQLLFQEGMRIEFFEQDGDNVRTNRVTVRIEETLAFPVYGDNYFIVGDFGNES